jgi:phosphoglycolate phosphatase
MKTSHKLIVFDWDGTLMDSECKIVNCIAAAAADCGVPDPGPAASRNIIGLGLKEAMHLLFPLVDQEKQDAITERYRQHFLQHDQTAALLFPGVAEGLKNLAQRGYLLAVATGKSRRGLQRVLAETNLGHLFAVTRCADEAFSKPHPKMLEDILAFTGMTSDQALMVGDTVYDMQMAQNARMARLAVSYGVHKREQLLEHTPLACVNSFQEVCAWFN